MSRLRIPTEMGVSPTSSTRALQNCPRFGRSRFYRAICCSPTMCQPRPLRESRFSRSVRIRFCMRWTTQVISDSRLRGRISASSCIRCIRAAARQLKGIIPPRLARQCSQAWPRPRVLSSSMRRSTICREPSPSQMRNKPTSICQCRVCGHCIRKSPPPSITR